MTHWRTITVPDLRHRGRALPVVLAIILGLLGMHYLPDMTELVSGTSTMMLGNHASVRPSSGSTADCVGDCLTAHDMTMAMTCTLALLFTSLVLIVMSVLLHARETDLLRRIEALWRARLESLPPPRPPSLHVLSISRT